MPTESELIGLLDVAKRAVEICDPAGRDPHLGQLLAHFEDNDEPLAALDDLEERVEIAAEGVDVEDEDPAVSMVAATILYLVRRRSAPPADERELLRLAALAEWEGDPPERVVDWLAERGVHA